MNPQKHTMTVLAQIARWIPDRIIENLALRHKIQTRSFSTGSGRPMKTTFRSPSRNWSVIRCCASSRLTVTCADKSKPAKVLAAGKCAWWTRRLAERSRRARFFDSCCPRRVPPHRGGNGRTCGGVLYAFARTQNTFGFRFLACRI